MEGEHSSRQSATTFASGKTFVWTNPLLLIRYQRNKKKKAEVNCENEVQSQHCLSSLAGLSTAVTQSTENGWRVEMKCQDARLLHLNKGFLGLANTCSCPNKRQVIRRMGLAFPSHPILAHWKILHVQKMIWPPKLTTVLVRD